MHHGEPASVEPPARQSSSRVISISALLIGAVAVTFLCLRIEENRRREKLLLPRRQLRQLLLGIHNYHSIHSAFPYDERGPRYALYLVHTHLDDPQVPLNWDHDHQRLDEPGIEYRNNPSGSPQWDRFILMSTIPEFPETILLAYASGGISSYECLDTPDRSLLDSCETVDGFLVADADTLQEWNITRPDPGVSWSQTTNVTAEGARRISATAGDFSFRYVIAKGRLSQCTITTPKGTITEHITTDRFGRISGISRSPENWRELLPPSPSRSVDPDDRGQDE
mgnify:CR=1 FL=1